MRQLLDQVFFIISKFYFQRTIFSAALANFLQNQNKKQKRQTNRRRVAALN